jgi:cell division protease FtsH
MSDAIGPMTVGSEERQVFLGRDFTQNESLSEATAMLVDSEIRNIINTAYETAMSILKKNRNLLDKMAILLLEKETLTIEEIFEIINSDLSPEDKELIERKYKKACEMKIDTSPPLPKKRQPKPKPNKVDITIDDSTPTETPVSTKKRKPRKPKQTDPDSAPPDQDKPKTPRKPRTNTKKD